MAYHGVHFGCYNCGRRATHIGVVGGDPYLDVPVCDDCAGETVGSLPQVGAKMLDVCVAVSGNEGCSKIKIARMVDPQSPLKRGWRALTRTIDAGLVKALPVDGGYQLFLTRLGWALVRTRD